MGVEDYGIGHRPAGPDYGAPLHDVTRDMYPKDWYDSPYMYSAYDGPGADEAIRIVQQSRDQPSKTIKIYRAIGKDVVRGTMTGEINDGDWVAISLEYAKQHGRSNLSDGFAILVAWVPADTLWTDANSINEWGYVGSTIPAEVIYKSRNRSARVASIEDAQPYFDVPGVVDWNPPGMPWEGFWIYAPTTHGGAYVGLYDQGRDGDFEDYKLYAGRQPKIAKIEWFQYGERRGEVSMIWTDALYRELGIATALFNWTKANVLPELHHSLEMTDAGHAWSQSMGYDPENWERVRVREHWSTRTAGTVSEPGVIFRGFGVPFGEAQWEEIREVEGTDRLAGRVLSYLTQGFFNEGGLGRHWTIDENIAKNYSYNGRGWPVVVVADWDGRGEDRDTSFGGGQSVGQTWEHEQEVTLLPGTELRLIDIWWGPAMESIVPPGDRLVGFTIKAGRDTPMISDEARLLFVRIAHMIEGATEHEAVGRGFYKVPDSDWGKGIMDLVDQGGFSFHDAAGDCPSSGYMVSIDPQAEKIIPTYDVTPADIGEFMEMWGWMVSDPSKYVGGWVYRGKLYLDISTHVATLEEAARLAKQYNQIAIFDLGNMEEIMTDDALRQVEERQPSFAAGRRPRGRVLIIR